MDRLEGCLTAQWCKLKANESLCFMSQDDHFTGQGNFFICAALYTVVNWSTGRSLIANHSSSRKIWTFSS